MMDEPDVEAPASAVVFFTSCDASALTDPDSGTSPMSRVSGSLSDVSSGRICKMQMMPFMSDSTNGQLKLIKYNSYQLREKAKSRSCW